MLQIWNGKTFRYYSDDELAYTSSLLCAAGDVDKYGFTSYMLKNKADKKAFGHFRHKVKDIRLAAAALMYIAEKRCPLMRRMQEEKRMRNMFLDIPGHYTFFFGETILYYDYPVIFTCGDKKGQLWLFEEVVNDKERAAWEAVKINEKQLSDLKDDRISIQSLFRSAKPPFVLVSHMYSGNATVCREYDKLPYPEVTENDTYYNDVHQQ